MQQTENPGFHGSKQKQESSVNTQLPAEKASTNHQTAEDHVTYAVIGPDLLHDHQQQQQFEESTQCNVIYAELERVVKNL